jgi:hypothetical protein
MAPEYVFARQRTVEILTRPEKILDAIRATIHEYPKNEQAHLL